MLRRLPGELSAIADAPLSLAPVDAVLTETMLPLASVTVVVTEPSAFVVTLVVSLEDELPPADDDDEADDALPVAVADALPVVLSGRVDVVDRAWLMLPLMEDAPVAVLRILAANG